MTLVRFVPFGPEATALLRERVAAAKAGDALAPVTVAVPSNYAGLWLRRELAKDGLVNVRFLVMSRVAELLGAPALAATGRTPLTPALRAEAIRAALDAAPGVFGPVAGHAGTERALDQTFRELRDVPESALDVLAGQSARARDVVGLYRAFREMSRKYYDETDVSEAAAEAVRAGAGGLADLGYVVVHLPQRLSRAEVSFLAALRQRGRADVLIGATGDADADVDAVRMVEALGVAAELPALAVRRADELVVAPDLEEEVRTAIRNVIARIEAGEPLGRMAVLYANAQPYARVLHEQLAAAGVPHGGPSSRTMAETLAGRHLSRLLALRDSDLRRDVVMEWLTSAPVREREGGREVAAARWDELSREAGVVRGLGQWRSRLERHAKGFETKAEESRREGPEWLIERNERDAARVRELLAFVEELAERLGAADGLDSWTTFADWALATQRRYLGAAAKLPWDDQAELQAAESIEDALEGLRGLDGMGRGATFETFRRTVDGLLEAPAGRAGPFGRGLFVGPLSAAAGLEFDTVYVLGMVEGQLPARGRDDPLLPAEERAATGGALEPRERVREQRRQYLAALGAGRRVVLSYAQSDLRSQRKQLPSRWLVESASALAGRAIKTSEVPDLKAPWATQVASFASSVARAGVLLSVQEVRLRRMASDAGRAAVGREYPRLSAGIEAGAARMGDEFTRWDGFIGEQDGLAPSVGRPASPTSLEQWAKCPLSYYLRSVLRVAEFEVPEEGIMLSPRDRGTLIHGILQEFFETTRERDPRAEWTERERDLLAEMGARACAEAEAAGLGGKPLLWQAERARLLRDLAAFLDEDHATRTFARSRFLAAEHTFGMKGGAPAVVVDLGDGRQVAFRGQIDRVDQSDTGDLRVYDYKSGSSGSYKTITKDTGDPVDAGKRLQLPIYALAARQAFGSEDAHVWATYWFIDEREQFAKLGWEVDEGKLGRFREALGLIVDGIEGGVFPANPGSARQKGYGNCNYCAYDKLCQGDRMTRWEKRQGAAGLEVYNELAGGGANGDD